MKTETEKTTAQKAMLRQLGVGEKPTSAQLIKALEKECAVREGETWEVNAARVHDVMAALYPDDPLYTSEKRAATIRSAELTQRRDEHQDQYVLRLLSALDPTERIIWFALASHIAVMKVMPKQGFKAVKDPEVGWHTEWIEAPKKET